MNIEQLKNHITPYLTGETFIQAACILAALALSFFLARWIRATINHALEDGKKEWIDPILKSVRTIAYPACLTAFFLLYAFTAEYFSFETRIVGIALNLSIAWLAIIFITQFIRKTVLARWIAVAIWVVAALHILGAWETVTTTLDGIELSMGERIFSVLDILRGLVSFAIFCWVAMVLARAGEKYIRSVNDFTPSLKVLLAKLLKITLVCIAIMFGLSAMGFDLTGLAIFSGAVGVGLGFGLQKIVSNFVSGIILLLDRSVKPGDVIALDAGGEKTFGWVNNMGSRYVSVIQRDGKEHLIPNELLITQKVENWSFSNDLIRLHIPIGVSYHSDVHKVRALVLEALAEEPRIKDNPPPLCHMVEFGDSSVNFQARGWISDPVNGVTNVKSDVLFRVWDKFKEHGIEIPFPQRDLHVRSVDDNVMRDWFEKKPA